MSDYEVRTIGGTPHEVGGKPVIQPVDYMTPERSGDPVFLGAVVAVALVSGGVGLVIGFLMGLAV